MSPQRLFDWDEARRLRAEGLTYVELASRFGVSRSTVRRACDDDARRRQVEWLQAYRLTKVCPGPGCGKPIDSRSSLCRDCRRQEAEKKAALGQPECGEPRICKGCGTEFVTQNRQQIYCTKLCSTRSRNRGKGERGIEGGGKYAYTVTVTSRESVTDAWLTVVGFGPSKRAARVHAASQLPPGDWETMSVSSPSSIYNDLRKSA